MLRIKKGNKLPLIFVLYALYLAFTYLQGFIPFPGIFTSICQYGVILLGVISLLWKKQMKFSAYIAWGAAFILMMGLSLFYTPNASFAIAQGILPFVIQWLLNWAIYYQSRSRKELEILAHIYIIVGAVFCMVCILFHTEDLFNGGRFGYSVNRNPNEVVLQMLLPASFAFFYAFRKPRVDWRYLSLAILFTALMLLTGSKKSILILLIPLVMVIRKSGIRRLRYIMIGIGVLIAGVYLMFSVEAFYNSFGIRFEQLLSAMSDGGNGAESDYVRFAMRAEAFRLFLKNPILGNGCESFRELSGFGTYSHNNYTEILCSYGIVGAAIYYSLPVAYLVQAVKSKAQMSRDNMSLIIGLLLVYFLFDWGSVTIFSRYNMFLFMYVPMVYRYYQPKKNMKKRRRRIK